SCAASARSSSASSSDGAAPGTSAQNTQATSPLTSCGTPTAAASATKGCATTADSSSAGPSRLPAMFSVSSERPCRNQKPSSSTNAQSPCTQTPGSRRQYVSRYRSGSRQNPRVMPGNGLRQTSSPTSSRTGLPSTSTTSIAIPSAGPPREQALIGSARQADRKQAPTSVPPEQLMIGHGPPPTTSCSQR